MRRFPTSLWAYALFIAFAISLPYIVGIVMTPNGWEYSGAITMPDGAKVDYYSHMAKLWQGSEFDFDNNILFTHEDHAGLPTVQLFYYLMGAVAQVMGLSFSLIYQLTETILTVIMILAIWAFASRYLAANGERWIATLFATLVVGWSWILFFIAPEMTTQPEGTPIELWLFDAYNLLGPMVLPHFPAAIILQIIAFLTFDSWIRQPQVKYILILIPVLIASAIIQPYVVLLMFGVFGLVTGYHLFIKRTLKWMDTLWLLPPALAHGGIALYQYLLISSDPIWVTFTDQNQTLSPPIIYYVLGYLLLLIPIVIGWRHIYKAAKSDDRLVLPIVWVIVVAALLYAPIPTQRRYLLGVQTPLAILATIGWYQVVLSRIAVSWRPFANIPYITAGSLALLLVFGANLVGLTQPQSVQGVYYTADELSAADWVRENTTQDEVILTTFDWDTTGSGGKVVAMTGQRVFIGHWIETKDFDLKRAQLAEFYDPETEANWRIDFLDMIDASVIWYDADTENFGNWNPQNADYLQPVFESETVQLFAVLGDE